MHNCLKIFTKLCIVIWFTSGSLMVSAEEVLRISVAELPDVDKHPKEELHINLLQALDEQLPDIRFEIIKMPFARSIVELARDHVDAQLPILYDPQDALGATDYMMQMGVKLSDLAYTDENIYRARFVIVSREEIEITPSNYAQHSIETDISHVAFFSNRFVGSHSMKESIAKVQRGELSGYLFEEHKVKQVIRELDFVDHRLNTWAFYDIRFMVRNSPQGAKVKSLLGKGIAQLKQSGEFQAIMHDLISEHGY
ncbi:hypothetical protein [Planctobacterium marinum]|uniref:hypothetical protein n=1 Tax=Planctobacterium marinum TaxID=1631968 RepID=UPI001E617CC7|nr:hypothetical protein [Planctobacterium marinum]MCC2607474.1 hypothetical protein [Planctobacterium marinum]